MPWLRAGASNTPLWSLILAKTGGLSWLGEVNRLVCVTESQVATILLMVATYTPSATPGAAGHCAQASPMLGSMVGGGAEERITTSNLWHPEVANLVGAGWHPYPTKIIPSPRWGAAGVVQRTHEPVEPGPGLTSGGLFVWAPGTS